MLEKTMGESKTKRRLSGCLLAVAGFLGFALMVGVGKTFRDQLSPAVVTLFFVAVALLILYVISKSSPQRVDDIKAFNEKKQTLKDIGEKYNKKIRLLEKEFKNTAGTAAIRRGYSDEYGALWRSYRQESRAYSDNWDKTHLKQASLQKSWRRVIKIVVIILICSVGVNIGLKTESADSVASLMDNRVWNADNIPMPHMQNGNLYVSNPDSILSAAVVDSINIVLRRLDTELGIESAMVIVGHIEGDDPISMVRGIYNKYKVGRDNRGLVIVVGYLDHSYFIAPGRNLEADLTDQECNRLAKTYLIPSMKAEMPDSGMLYLARGVYALMADKDMPRMSALSGHQTTETEGEGGSMWIYLFYLLAVMGILHYNYRMGKKMGWAGLSYPMFIMSNPFQIYEGGSGGGSGGSGGSSHSSGGSSGGYGGGSWGGGGSGGRW